MIRVLSREEANVAASTPFLHLSLTSQFAPPRLTVRSLLSSISIWRHCLSYLAVVLEGDSGAVTTDQRTDGSSSWITRTTTVVAPTTHLSMFQRLSAEWRHCRQPERAWRRLEVKLNTDTVAKAFAAKINHLTAAVFRAMPVTDKSHALPLVGYPELHRISPHVVVAPMHRFRVDGNAGSLLSTRQYYSNLQTWHISAVCLIFYKWARLFVKKIMP